MMRTIVAMSLFALVSCATAQKATAPPAPEPAPAVEEKAPPAPDPAPPPAAEEGISYNLRLHLPDGWIAIPKEDLPEGATAAFIEPEQEVMGQLFVEMQPGTNANKILQMVALNLVMNGAQPIDLVPEDDGTAWLTFSAETPKGTLLGFIYVRPWKEVPDAYLMLSAIWLAGEPADNTLTLNQLKLIGVTTELTRQ